MKKTRKFLGKTEGFKDKTEKHFYNRMLNAYLKGNEYFQFGFKQDTNEPAWYKVAEGVA